ncbi:MAG: hypothetical protein DRH12_00310 [Deltaproteobacteria bacterium]|nr:MAG: hypothetical protein DRH12_00310 [Deltaproteobacteria bacterium]
MHKKSIPSGSFALGGKKKEVLEAYLGTCVGVALVDNDAEIGGLIHILLPEPTGTDIPFSPAVYATTGLPLLIEKLNEAGARRSKLKGCIAGGGLVGEVSEQDLMLDIGGRTAETVEDILREQGVAVESVETGGLFPCKISLRMDTFETSIEPIVQQGGGQEAGDINISKDEIMQAIKEVKPIPQIALKVIRMLREKEYDIDDIAMEIMQDQVISAKVLKLANSPIVGAATTVDSIDRALIVLGEKKLFQLVLSATVEMLFADTRTGGYSLCKGGIFHHALATAMTAHEISVFTRRSQPDIAYTGGLLHDIGKIALDQYVITNAPLFYRSLQDKGVDLCKVEKVRFGLEHTEMGFMLAKKWGLPSVLSDVIRYHHEPENSQEDRELVSIVYLADLLMTRFRVGYQVDRPNTEMLEKSLSHIGLGKEDFPIIIDRIPRAVFESTLLAT